MAMMTMASSVLVHTIIIASLPYLSIASSTTATAITTTTHHHHLAGTRLPTPSSPKRNLQYICEGPPAGCNNGLWNQDECYCDCIPPFCRDSIGDCTVPTGNCGGNPWTDCKEDEDCPWWISDVDAGGSDVENCSTGNEVPVGQWKVYASETICCRAERPYSKVCDTSTTSPTEAPVAAPGFDDLYEVIPIKFSVVGLPEAVEMRLRELKDEMLIILKRILTDLAERMSSLKITNVEENFLPNVVEQEDGTTDIGTDTTGKLNVYYDVTVVRQDGKEFGPTIIQWMQESYDNILEQIQEYTTREYFGYDINMNWCVGENGQFKVCNDEIVPFKTSFAKIDNATMDILVPYLVESYEDILLSGVDDLDISIIEVTDVVYLPGGSVDVFFDIHVAQKFGKEFGPAIAATIEDGQDDILERIQSYSDVGMLSDLSWCFDQKEGSFTTCDEEEEVAEKPIPYTEESTSGLPFWAIIAMATFGVLFCCFVLFCVMTYNKKRDEEKNDIKMMSYVQSGSGGLNDGRKETKTKEPPQSIYLGDPPRNLPTYEPKRGSSRRLIQDSQPQSQRQLARQVSHRSRRDCLERRNSYDQSRRNSLQESRRDSHRQLKHDSHRQSRRNSHTPRRDSNETTLLESSRRSSRKLSTSRRASRKSLKRRETGSTRASDSDAWDIDDIELALDGIASSTGASREEGPRLASETSGPVSVNESRRADPPTYSERRSSRRRSSLDLDNPVSAQESQPSTSRRRSSLDPDGEHIKKLWLDDEMDGINLHNQHENASNRELVMYDDYKPIRGSTRERSIN